MLFLIFIIIAFQWLWNNLILVKILHVLLLLLQSFWATIYDASYAVAVYNLKDVA